MRLEPVRGIAEGEEQRGGEQSLAYCGVESQTARAGTVGDMLEAASYYCTFNQ